MSLFGVQVNAQANTLILQIRLKLSHSKLRANFRTIYRSFAHYDPDISGLIATQFFEKALNQNGLFFKKQDMQVFEKMYSNQKGFINWFQFLKHLKQPMGPIRRNVVQQTFSTLSNNSNQISIDQLSKHFRGEGYDSFKKVTKDQKQSLQSLINNLSIQNGRIKKQEFVSYYDDLNINFPSDESFLKFISNQWGCKVSQTQKVSDQQIKSLIQKSNGTSDEFLLRKIFEEFDMNRNGSIGAYQLDLMLKKLQLPVSPKLVNPLLTHLDKNKTNYIQFDQFKKLVFFDPFAK